MGSHTCGIVGEPQSVLMMIDPILSSPASVAQRMATSQSLATMGAGRHVRGGGMSAQGPLYTPASSRAMGRRARGLACTARQLQAIWRRISYGAHLPSARRQGGSSSRSASQVGWPLCTAIRRMRSGWRSERLRILSVERLSVERGDCQYHGTNRASRVWLVPCGQSRECAIRRVEWVAVPAGLRARRANRGARLCTHPTATHRLAA
jgi:hypothetical protein